MTPPSQGRRIEVAVRIRAAVAAVRGQVRWCGQGRRPRGAADEGGGAVRGGATDRGKVVTEVVGRLLRGW